ncbi:MAG: rod shape-determining protein MreD [Erysipelotrichaceae bacterium]
MKVHALFVFCCFLIDGVLTVLFPSNYLLNQTIFIPCLGFSAMVLTIRKFNFVNACLFACCFGMFYDFFYARTFMLYMIIFTLVAMIVYFWSKHMMDTMIELLVLSISTIFVKELMVYWVMSLQHHTLMTLSEWFVNREFITLIGNGVLVIIVVFLGRIKDDYLQLKDSRIRKEERLEWVKLLSKH